MRTIPRTYTLRQLRGLHGEFKTDYGFMGNDITAFLAWLQDREDRAEEEADRFFRGVEK